MYIIVGLGNPEEDYAKTRHNMGFNVINKIAKQYEIEVTKKKFQGLYGMGNIEGEKVILLKPQTFMNLSGKSVQEILNFYKLEPTQLIVIYDDIDLEPGLIRLRKSGGAGTHNGMKSVIHELNVQNFKRVRVGIGMPEKKEDLIEYVIGAISDEDKEKLEKGIELAKEAVIEILKNGIDIAMNKFN
ncbi:MAG: aminoacyl-tRNA hydrolase [Clostridia bacterium]|nr:aminoacyl-tRNA hydrolase [Clostridia bacterium]